MSTKILDEYSDKIAFMFMLLIGAWLAYAATVVAIEFDDGYATVANARHLMGLTDGYFWQRPPLLAILLMPTQWLAQKLGMHPLDMRLHHGLFALIHMTYMLGVWTFMKARFGARFSTLLAFLFAVPTFLFFSYAPFISHDIFPGLLVLLLVYYAHAYTKQPSKAVWLTVALLGALLATIKQAYALVCLATLTGLLLEVFIFPEQRAESLRRWLFLLCAFMLGGTITWLIYSWSLASTFGDVPMWLRPWKQIIGILTYADPGASSSFYPWVYLRNLSAYGVLAMALVLPGAVLSLRASAFQRLIAIVWIMLVLAIQCLQFKEVRYFGFLAPLTAVLIIPAIDALMKFRARYAYLLALFWLFDVQAIAFEATRIRAPFYKSAVSDFFSVLPLAQNLTGPIVFPTPLSFVSPERYAFFADRYHRITNVVSEEIRMIYGYPSDRVLSMTSQSEMIAAAEVPGAVLFVASDLATRRPPFRGDNIPFLDNGFTQFAAIAERVSLRREGGDYRALSESNRPIMFFSVPGRKFHSVTGISYFPVGDIQQLRGLDEAPDELQLIGFRIMVFCNISGCAAQ